MAERDVAKTTVMRTLVGHFFRRFFDNDTVHVQGETLTTVVRAVAAVAVPGLMAAFFLQNQYPRRPLWGRVQDEYFFVLFSFVAMGAVTVVEWEMLFPDRLDVLVLTPLSMKPRQMLGAKVLALAGFLGLFLVAANIFGALVLPAVSKGTFYRQCFSHGVATGLAGVFAAAALLAVGGTMLCVFDPRRFRVASPLLQMGTVVVLGLMLAQYGRYGDSLEAMLSTPIGEARWMPPFWFLGVYEVLLRGSAAPAFARELARYAWWGTGLAMLGVVATYPLAWAQMQRMTIEGETHGKRPPLRWGRRVVDALVRRPGERAMVHLIAHTMTRNARYQVYLAIYGGLGLSLAMACAVQLRQQGGRFTPVASDAGLHALLPLLLFWVVAGLHTAFAMPLSLAAGWIFRVTAVRVSECADAARRWTLWCGLAITGLVAGVVRLAGWDVRRVLVQMVCGVCLTVLLTDGFFFSEEHVPFNRPRMPGRTNFPLLLTLYMAIFPLFVVGMMRLEMRLETRFTDVLLLAVGTALVHAGMVRLRREPAILEEDLEGYDEEFQLLGLS